MTQPPETERDPTCEKSVPAAASVKVPTSQRALIIYLGGILVSLVATMLAIDQTIVAVEGGLDNITLVKEPARAAAYEMEVALLGSGLGMKKYLETGQEANRVRFQADTADFEKYRAKFQQSVVTPEEVAYDRRLGILFAEYRAMGEKLITMADEERTVAAQLAAALNGIDDLLDRELEVRLSSRTSTRAAFMKIGQGIDAELGEAGTWLGSYQRTLREDDRWRLQGKIRRVRDYLTALNGLKLATADRALADEVVAAVENGLGLIEKIVAADSLVEQQQKGFTKLRDEIDDLLDDHLETVTEDDLSASADPASRRMRRLRWTNFALCGSVLLIGVAAAVAILRRSRLLAVANRELRGQIAEREKAERARGRLQEKLVVAQEDERRRLARELHDEVGQQLAAIKVALTRVGAGEQASGPLAEVREMADRAIDQTRQIAWELRPAMLDDLGLESALQRYIETWAHQARVSVDPVFKLGGVRLPAEVESTVFRIVQEALSNILKHAEARTVSVIVERRPEGVQIVVEDDGKGFDSAAGPSSDRPRLGLLGMGERVGLAGGTLEIESEPGVGTTIVARLPLRAGARFLS